MNFREQILPVSIFNEAVNIHLKRLGEVIVEGEISELKVSQGKWLFLTIKDEKASVNVFAPVYKISTLNALEEGMKVHVYATPSLYQKTARFSLNASQIVPAGEGALRLAYEKLKQKLDAEGLFDLARKREIVKFPEKIGLITAKGSKAYSDFLKILKERMGGIKIYFYPVQVQGKNAVNSIIGAFNYFNQNKLDLDALIIIRGGGSLEDLLAFNDESVARAVFASKTPVISGIGHEEDIALTDLVADLRASTPSNAAQLLVLNRTEALAEIKHFLLVLERNIRILIKEGLDRVDYHLAVLNSFFDQEIIKFKQIVASLSKNLILRKEKTVLLQNQVINKYDNLNRFIAFYLKQNKQNFENLERLLTNFDHHKILKRGFSISKDANGKIIKSSQQLNKDELMTTTLHDGDIKSKVI